MINPSSLIQKIKDKLAAPKGGQAQKVIKNVTFNDVRSLYRPAPSWRWVLSLPPLPSAQGPVKPGPKNPLLKAISKFLSAAPDSRIIMCEEIEVSPNWTLGKQDRYYNGRMTTFPNLPSLPPVTATFYESEDYMTTDYFIKWQNEVCNPKTRIYGLPASYGRDIEFIALPVTDQEDVSRYFSIVFKKAWPCELSKFNYGHTTDRIKLQVEFAYLDYEVTIVGGPPSDGKSGAGELVNKALQWRS